MPAYHPLNMKSEKEDNNVNMEIDVAAKPRKGAQNQENKDTMSGSNISMEQKDSIMEYKEEAQHTTRLQRKYGRKMGTKWHPVPKDTRDFVSTYIRLLDLLFR